MSVLPPIDPFERRYQEVLVVSKGASTEEFEYATQRALENMVRAMVRACGCERGELIEHFTFIWDQFRPVISFDEETGKAQTWADMLRASWEALPKSKVAS